MKKITVLLIHDTAHKDDEGDPRFRRASNQKRGDPPSLPDAWLPYFELKWIRTPYEGRWVLDAVDALAENPQSLGGAGFPPEIILFDYSMMRFDSSVRQNGDLTDPVPALAAKLAALRIDHPIAPTPSELVKVAPLPQSLDKGGSDRIGCYIGGTFTRSFSYHPCVGMPCTIFTSSDNAGKDVLFFEWFSGTNYTDAFDEQLRGAVMDDLLKVATKLLRERISALLASGALSISFKSFHKLIDGSPEIAWEEEHLRFYSVYGKRDLPLRALFADCWPIGSPITSNIRKEVKSCLSGWMEALFKTREGYNIYIQALELQDRYQRIQESEEHSLREKLMSLLLCHCGASGLSGDEVTEFQKLAKRFGLEIELAKWPKRLDEMKGPSFTIQEGVVPHMGNAATEHRVVRLAILLMCVWVAFDLSSEEKATTYRDIADEKPIKTGIAHYYDYLDPLPEEPFLETVPSFKDRHQRVNSKLKSLKHEERNIGLNVNRLLGGTSREANENIFLPPTQHEIQLMVLFAQDIGWQKSDWAPWFLKLTKQA